VEGNKKIRSAATALCFPVPSVAAIPVLFLGSDFPISQTGVLLFLYSCTPVLLLEVLASAGQIHDVTLLQLRDPR